MQWNAQSLVNTTRLEDLLTTLQSHQIEVALLSEVWWDTNFNPPPTIPGYSLYTRLRDIPSPLNRGGGVAILVHNSIPSQLHRKEADSESLWVKIFPSPSSHILLCSTYIRPNKPTDMSSFLRASTPITQSDSPFFICGDFNAHHPTWDSIETPSRPSNRLGKLLHAHVNQQNLHVVPLKRATYSPHQLSQNPSTIDHAITTPELSNRITSKVTNLLSSDHNPILHKFNTTRNSPPAFRPSWKLRSADANSWREISDSSFSTFVSDHAEVSDPSQLVEALTSKLHQLLLQNIKKTRPPRQHSYKPWWTPLLTQLSKRRKRARRLWQRHRTPATRADYTQSNRNFYKNLRLAEQHYKRDTASRLTSNPNARRNVWKHLRKLASDSIPATNRPLRDPKTSAIYTTNLQKSNALASQFARVSSSQHSTNPQSESQTQRVHHHLQEHKEDFQPHHNPNDNYNAHLTLPELQAALSSLQDTAPGLDDIPNWCLKNAGSSLQQAILFVFNTSWIKGVHPQQWKSANIHPLPKPYKNHSDPSNYRPISLLSSLSKLMDRVIYNRLHYIAESRGFLHPQQFAYRSNNSTEQLLLSLTTSIQKSLNQDSTSILVALDIQKAFDSVWPDGVRYKLHKQLKIQGRLLSWLSSFLQNRRISVTFNGIPSDTHSVDIGVPQGSVLSALLFIIYINDLPSIVQSPSFLYADDTSLFETHKNFSICCKRIQASLDSILNWSHQWRVKFHPDKCTYTIFSNRQIPPQLTSPLTLGLFSLKQNPTPTVLGLVIDNKLTFKEHLQKTLASASRKLNLLRKISGQNWGANRTTLSLIYRTYILPTLEYASSAWYHSKYANTLNTLHNSALRLILGAKISTPIHILHAELNFLTLTARRQQKLLKITYKTTFLHTKHPLKLLLQQQPSRTSRTQRPEGAPTPVSSALRLYKELFSERLHTNPPVHELLHQHSPFPPWIKPEQPPRLNRRILSFNKNLQTKLRENLLRDYIQDTKGSFYHKLRPDPTQHFSVTDLTSKSLTSALFRIRSGHNQLPAHDRLQSSKNCKHCNVPYNLQHLLYHCPLHNQARIKLFRSLNQLTFAQVPYTIKNLIGTETSFTTNQLKSILPILVNFFQLTIRNLDF